MSAHRSTSSRNDELALSTVGRIAASRSRWNSAGAGSRHRFPRRRALRQPGYPCTAGADDFHLTKSTCSPSSLFWAESIRPQPCRWSTSPRRSTSRAMILALVSSLRAVRIGSIAEYRSARVNRSNAAWEAGALTRASRRSSGMVTCACPRYALTQRPSALAAATSATPRSRNRRSSIRRWMISTLRFDQFERGRRGVKR